MEHVRLADLSMHFDDEATLMVRSQAHGCAARVPPPAIAVLALCARPCTREQVAARLGPALAGLYDGLVDAGLLVTPERAADTPTFFQNFAGIEIHRRMLADGPRVDAYARAIAAAVEPGMAVLDAGTGSGLLACLAARAGARVVYAVDNSDVLALAEQTVRHNDLGEIVRLVRGDFGTVQLPERVDLIVSETFGALALAEGSVPDLAACVQRNLAPSGRVLPSGISLHLAPAHAPAVHDQTLSPFGDLHGVDLEPLRQSAERRGRVVDVPASALRAPAAAFAQAPYPTQPSMRGTAAWQLPEGPITGFAAWFDIHDQGEVFLSTGPAAAPTHWRQVYLPLPPLTVPPGGAALHADVTVRPAADDRRSIEVHIAWRLGDLSGQRTWRVR